MARIVAWIFGAGLYYVRGAIIALTVIVAMILSSVDIQSWSFWVVLALVVGLVIFFRGGLWRMFTGMWRITLILGVIFIIWVILFRALPVAMLLASSWWGSAKAVVASPTAGQMAPNVDMTAPTLPTSQVVATTMTVPVAQPIVAQCPPGLTCTSVQAVAPQQAIVVTSSAVQPSSQKGGGRSMDELMTGGASEEALAMSRRLSGDGQ